MPAILRKSFTACEALAALPPTPRMNKRPPAARVWDSKEAAFSMLAASSRSITSLASARNPCANEIVLLIADLASRTLTTKDTKLHEGNRPTFLVTILDSLPVLPGTRRSPVVPPANLFHRNAHALHRPRAACVAADPCTVQRDRKLF